jgi:hypothetical protein
VMQASARLVVQFEPAALPQPFNTKAEERT